MLAVARSAWRPSGRKSVGLDGSKEKILRSSPGFGEEKPDRLAEIATDLVRLKVDVIVCASTERKRVVDLAATYRLPAIYPQEEYMNVGGLMYYGFDPADNYRRADI